MFCDFAVPYMTANCLLITLFQIRLLTLEPPPPPLGFGLARKCQQHLHKQRANKQTKEKITTNAFIFTLSIYNYFGKIFFS